MKILITGSKGFIGSRLMKILKKKGHKVYGFDLGDKYPKQKVDLVYHLASFANAFHSISHPEILMNNVQVTFNTLEWMRKTGTKKMVFSSTREIYTPVNPYGASKLMCEAMFNPYVKTYGMGIVSARLTNIYGKGNLSYRFIGDCVTKCKNNETVNIYGGYNKVMSFLHVNDCIDQLVSLGKRVKLSHHKTVDVSYPNSIMLMELTSIIKQKTGSSSKIIALPGRKGEVMSYNPPSIYKLPKISLQQGLDEEIS